MKCIQVFLYFIANLSVVFTAYLCNKQFSHFNKTCFHCIASFLNYFHEKLQPTESDTKDPVQASIQIVNKNTNKRYSRVLSRNMFSVPSQEITGYFISVTMWSANSWSAIILNNVFALLIAVIILKHDYCGSMFNTCGVLQYPFY